MINGRRREMGLGSVWDVSLAQAREKAAAARVMHLEGLDPIKSRPKLKVAERAVPTFGEFAMQHLDDIEGGFRNPKHRQQWRNTLKTYAAPIFGLPITEVATEHVLGVLQPIELVRSRNSSSSAPPVLLDNKTGNV
jgi:hypothetical protein